jgi:hypothetical protein
LTQNTTCKHEYLGRGLTRPNDVSRKIQGRFREDSGKIQGRFREHSGNIQGTFREHYGNITGTFREHPELKAKARIDFHRGYRALHWPRLLT